MHFSFWHIHKPLGDRTFAMIWISLSSYSQLSFECYVSTVGDFLGVVYCLECRAEVVEIVSQRLKFINCPLGLASLYLLVDLGINSFCCLLMFFSTTMDSNSLKQWAKRNLSSLSCFQWVLWSQWCERAQYIAKPTCNYLMYTVATHQNFTGKQNAVFWWLWSQYLYCANYVAMLRSLIDLYHLGLGMYPLWCIYTQ